MIRENGWYWCRINDFAEEPLCVLQWCDDFWQVADMAYDDDQITVVSPRLVPPEGCNKV